MTGLDEINYEMARQHADAIETFATARNVASRIAASIRQTGRLLLLGMGGSHCVNRTVMFSYRELGIEVQAEVLSEVLFRRLPDVPRTVILTSQSGNSGEVGHYLRGKQTFEDAFGVTLNNESVLASAIPSLIGAGGPERAFAATRSILLSHVMHLAVMEALGMPVDTSIAAVAEKQAIPRDVRAAVESLSRCNTIVLSGRSELQGVAESGALCLMELARMSTHAFEGGQLRHGPYEMLNAETGIIFLAASDTEMELLTDLVKDCAAIGSTCVVISAAKDTEIAGAAVLSAPPSRGMEAVIRLLPILQSLLVQIAARKVVNVGTPLRSTKVTTKL
jgi:fructoselysine-6-P-deglycase FrlB-like protein